VKTLSAIEQEAEKSNQTRCCEQKDHNPPLILSEKEVAESAAENVTPSPGIPDKVHHRSTLNGRSHLGSVQASEGHAHAYSKLVEEADNYEGREIPSHGGHDSEKDEDKGNYENESFSAILICQPLDEGPQRDAQVDDGEAHRKLDSVEVPLCLDYGQEQPAGDCLSGFSDVY
jgi:hypothetical protein